MVGLGCSCCDGDTIVGVAVAVVVVVAVVTHTFQSNSNWVSFVPCKHMYDYIANNQDTSRIGFCPADFSYQIRSAL